MENEKEAGGAIVSVTASNGTVVTADQATFLEHEKNPGIEVRQHSNLEVAEPRPGLSVNRTWEKPSGLPEPALRSIVLGPEPPHVVVETPAFHHLGLADDEKGNNKSPPPLPTVLFGVKRQTFWIGVAVSVFLAVTAIAVGIGVGVARRNISTVADTPTTTTTTATSDDPNNSGAGSPSHNRFPVPTAQGWTGPGQNIQCPVNNLTLYTSTAATSEARSYIFFCGRDYPWEKGSIDLMSTPMDSMSDCIDLCAIADKCVAASWGMYQGKNICFIKSHVANAQWNPGWYFAVSDQVNR
ncbi:hypothetical protein B0H66DRAFT_202512 [Apodospora peruviana]|uniref:Apple domain-containing protein n=1 Tax=Apodospora peruviana TaxID=516989 RepID=A0AAE0ICD3_9PEZI|nr:hypothetical protein B0H66DRAFT_202512 [Apodospora peruviana]